MRPQADQTPGPIPNLFFGTPSSPHCHLELWAATGDDRGIPQPFSGDSLSVTEPAGTSTREGFALQAQAAALLGLDPCRVGNLPPPAALTAVKRPANQLRSGRMAGHPHDLAVCAGHATGLATRITPGPPEYLIWLCATNARVLQFSRMRWRPAPKSVHWSIRNSWVHTFRRLLSGGTLARRVESATGRKKPGETSRGDGKVYEDSRENGSICRLAASRRRPR